MSAAARRQKQLERKYSSFRKYQATEDVNYATHSSRSSYRSESVTSRTSPSGRSSSTEVSTGSETRSLPVFIALQDYNPEPTDTEAVPLEQGQIVEVLDNKNPASWLVRTKARPPRTGWVPGSYFETPSEYYKQRRHTRELVSSQSTLTESQESLLKRDQVYHDLLRTEEDFVSDLLSVVDNYIRALEDPAAPPEVKKHLGDLIVNLRELYNFHANVMLKGLQYYSDNPGKVGQTFVRLEPDFDHHVQFYRTSPKALQLAEENPEIKDYLQRISDKIEAGAKTYSDYLRQISGRIKQYEDFFKEIIKYSARAGTSTKSMQKALELIQSIPKRAEDAVYTSNIQNYPGDKNRLGRLLRHDLFNVWEGEAAQPKQSYVFLFNNNKLMFTERKAEGPEAAIYDHYATIRLDKYTARVPTTDDDAIVLRPNEPGLPSFRIKAKDMPSQEVVRKAWLKDINEMQEAYSTEHHYDNTSSVTATEFDVVSISDVRSEFSEYSSVSRKSSLHNGPEEGPPRKKIKSPPGISPTGSSTSLYSGGSSIDWTTTGTTLEMQGTRVTRTQYGFRTLQESSAKMCLKVTGYPLPDITWYKDDQLLKEDERHTFYADEDGFFAMTIDPVQVTDTGRYTCVATNEYGQASTSAFFRVLKVEKEAAPPAFAMPLQDQTVKEGEVVSFECEVEGWPEPELIWLVDDHPLRPSTDFRLQYDGQNAKLEIRDAQPEDTGTYAVKLTNEYGTTAVAAKLVVEADPDKNHVPPEFQAIIDDVDANEGDTVRFKAVLTGDPNPEVTWLINGIPLSESEKIKFINEDGICILTIRDVTRHFDGTVTCQGKNRLGTTSCEANLRIRVPPAAPTFSKPLEDKETIENGSVSFECDVDGYPDPAVQFALNGTHLAQGIDGVEISSRDGRYKVTINNAAAAWHAGEIVATAKNDFGKADCRAKLTFGVDDRVAPTFIKDIEDQTVKAGQQATFETAVRGNPPPSVTWFLNGQPINPSSPGIQITSAGPDHKIGFDSSKYAGTVFALAENAIGRFETKARLIVLPAEKAKKAPEFIEQLQNISGAEGGRVVFEARIDAEPRPQIKWTLNGQELVESERIHIRDFDGSVKLEIDEITLKDAGSVTVTATNYEGTTISEAILEVSHKPTFDTKLSSVKVDRGTEAVFEAHANAVPPPEYTWAIGGRTIRPTTDGARIEATLNGGTKLIVDTGRFFESATVTLTAQNFQGSEETVGSLTVNEPPPKTLNVLRDLKDQTIEKGGLAHFEAVIENADRVSWAVNGNTVVPGQEGVKISQDDKFEFRVTLDTNIFNGPVTLKASSGNGTSIERSANLVVTARASEMKPPDFTDQLKNISAVLGQPLQVDVIALNDPNFSWQLNGSPLFNGVDDVHITQQGNKSTLKIDSVGPQHAGKLTVIAVNEAGKNESSANLNVAPPAPVEVQPHFKTALADTKIEEGKPLTFTVNVEGASPGTKVSWFLNNKKLENNDDIKVTANPDDGTYKLEIEKAGADLNGTLTVRAENAAGNDESKARIEVTTGEKEPSFSKTPQDHETEENESVKFSAIVVGVPVPQVKWFINDSEVIGNEEIKVKHEPETGKTSIRLYKPKIDQTGRVKVKASNKHGTIESSAELKVVKKREIPRFTQELRDMQVNEGSDVRFQAKIAAYPEPEVEWTLNGQKIGAENVKTITSADTYTIEFSNVKLAQAGELAVEAKNSLGSKKNNCTLAVKETGVPPFFVTNLTDRLVDERETVIMEAHLNKDVRPEPTITWQKDGASLTDTRFKTSYDASSGSIKLTLAQAELTDKSRITLKAENRWGAVESSASIGVTKKRPMAKPQFLSELAPISITEGDSLQTKVIITGDPKPYAKWYINNQMVYQTEDTEIKEENGVYSLTIHGCTTDMTGRIKIVAGNRMGEISTEGPITVIAPVPVEFETMLCDATCREGDTLKLKAVLLGEPTPVVTWYVNGKKLEESQNIKIHAEKGTYTVTIKDITLDYTGKVVCEAVNEFGRASSEASLVVLPRGEPPDFLEWLSNIRARQGSTVVHKVVFTGDPKPDIIWYINGQVVRDGLNGVTIKTSNNSSILTIKNFAPSQHSGEIICKAENDAGEVSCTANMITYTSDMFSESESEAMAEDVGITDDLTEASDAESVRDEYTRTPTPVMAPKFITKLKDTKTRKGHQAVFECVVPDTKGIVCKWLKDGKELELIARIRVQTRTIEGHVTNELIIDDVKPEDAGKYTVVVENSAGKEVCDALLTIVEEDISKAAQQSPPEFSIRLQDKQVKTSERAVYECKVSGTPAPTVSWYRDEEKLIEQSKQIIIESDDGVQRLVVENSQIKDSGIYKCVAENSAGKTSTEAKLEVRDDIEPQGDRAAGAPEFVELLRSALVAEGNPAVLKCRVKGDPRPATTWTFNGNTLTLNDRITTEYSEDGAITLTIRNATSADAGEYRCQAINEWGSAWTEAPVLLAAAGQLPKDGEAPDFLQPVRPVTVVVGQPAVLEGKIIGTPAPEVKWYKGGREITASDTRYRIESHADGTQKLSISESQFEDVAEYRCEATNKYGDVWSDATLTVHHAAKESVTPGGQAAPIFTRSLEETTSREHERTELECLVAGNPQPEVKWFKDDKPIAPSDTRLKQTIDADGVAKLVIADTNVKDAGKYTCEATNSVGSAKSDAPLKVTPDQPEKPPQFKQGLQPTQVKAGEPVLFDVKVDGHPPPTVQWFKDGEEVKPGECVKIEALPDGTHKLSLDKAKIDDQGNYRAEATNDAGSASSKAPLSVEPKEQLRIKKGLEDKQVPAGAIVELGVEIEGKPKNVKWFHATNELSDSKNNKLQKVSDQEFKLVIEDITIEQSGQYRVVLSTETASTESSCQLTIVDAGQNDKIPSFKKKLTDQQVPKGQPIKLEIEVDGKPKQVKWYKNGNELQPDGKNIIAQDLGDGKYAFIIPEAKDEDFATYSVKVINNAGEAESKATISQAKPSDQKPSFKKGLANQQVPKGQPIKLDIEVDGQPKQVKWYKNGNELKPDGKNIKAEDLGNGKYALTISESKDGDFGTYSVKISNDAGETECKGEVTPAKVADQKPSFRKRLTDQQVHKAQPIMLEVEVDGRPKQVKWYKNGNELKPDGKNVKAEDLGNGRYSLTIPESKDDDFGNYSVKISNDAGEAESKASVTPSKAAEHKPLFKKGLTDQQVPKGQPIKLDIEVDGQPKQVKWYKNGNELMPDGKNSKAEDLGNGKYALTILESKDDDFGTYSVKISNDAGEAESKGAVTLKDDKPRIVKGLQPIAVPHGERAVFEVEAAGPVRQVKWYKNGTELANPQSENIGDKKFRLIIPSAQSSDEGDYCVVLSNDSGSADSSAALTVKLPAAAKQNPPQFVKGLEDQVVAKGDALIFEVKVDGDVAELVWYKDGRPVGATAKRTIEALPDGVYRLTIPSADVSDAGKVEAVAKNPAGSVVTTGNAEVDEKPSIVRGLIPANIDVGDEQTFSVVVDKPVRTVKWYRNGQELAKPLGAKQVSPTKFQLTIPKSSLDDAGTYRVVLSNKAGECESQAELTVTKPNVLKILKGLSDATLDVKQPLQLTCKVEGTPKSAKWLKNGKEIVPDDQIKIFSNPATGEHSLVIDAVQSNDGAAYRVVFANDRGEVQSSALVNVNKPREKKKEAPALPPTLVSPIKDTTIEEGDTLTLRCQVSGEPQPEAKWYRNGQQLTPDGRIAIRLASDGTATLRITDAKKSDAGDFKIVATNLSGTVDSSCAVQVLKSDELPAKPKFVIPLRATDAPVGAFASFSVKVRAVPPAKLRFQLDGRDLPIDGTRVVLEDMADGNWTLTVNDLQENDFGILRCVAENEHGSVDCEAMFSQTGGRKPRSRDEEGWPPKFNVPLWDRRIPVGHPMSVECHVDARPLAEITWTFNGNEIKPGQGIEIENTSEGACRVKIFDFTEEHVGSYKCFAKNEYGTADTIANLKVEILSEEVDENVVEYAPRFNPGLEDKILKAGDSLSLSCRVEAVPTANVLWYKDGLPVRSTDRVKWSYCPATGEVTLTIGSVRDGDEGAYRCVASNHLGATNTACLVSVRTPKAEAPKAGAEPFFTKGLVDKYVDRGETLELNCAVTGDQPLEVKWYRNGTLLRASDKTTIEQSPDGACKLTVKGVTMSDEGIYRCEAENAFGKARTQCTAHVEMTIKREKTPIAIGEMPRFVITLEDLTVRPGSAIELSCKVTGVPMPSLKWVKDGGPLLEDSRFTWNNQPEKGQYNLIIASATVSDEGTYRVVATNDSGSASTKSMVRIDDGGVSPALLGPSAAPRIILRLADVRVNEGQPLRLECKIEGSPLPEVTWYKDGEKVPSSDRVQLELTADGMARLYIPRSTLADDGLYRIMATNSAGSAVDKCTATVRKSGDGGAGRGARGYSPLDLVRFSPLASAASGKAPKLITPLDNVKISEKSSFKLACKFAGEPKPTIKWFKDGQRLYSYSRCQIVEHPDGTTELTVPSASRQDGGTYRCVAENDFGSARTTGDVIVQLKERIRPSIDEQLREGNAPGFSVPLAVRRVKSGEPVVFECLPYGKPFPDIKWLKDGIEIRPDMSSGIKTETFPDGTQRLTIDAIDILNEGYFRCVATNEYGTASTKGELVVTGERRAPYTNGISEPLANGGPPEESRPRIRRGLYPLSIHQGNAAEMQVCVTGWPTPTVQWFRNGVEIGSSDEARRKIWTDERGLHHCIIVNVSPDDEADYQLVATNLLGKAKTEGPLSVIRPRIPYDDSGRPSGHPFPPGFIRQLKNKHIFTHMPTIFDCLVVGYPPPVVDWYHNGKKISPDSRKTIQVAGGGSHALIILETTLEDSGEYVAIARNTIGTAQSSAVLDVTVPYLDNIKFDGSIDITPYLTEEFGFKKLNVKCLPTPPDRGPFIKEVSGHHLTLSWIPSKRTPPRYPQVTYVIEIRELPDRDWTLLDYNIPEPVCKVRNLELGRSYQFRVRAENIYGISDPSPASPPSRLMAPPRPVLDKNKRVIPLLDPYAERALEQAYAEQFACAPWFAPGVVEKRYCAENDTITITLAISGYPDPKIEWKFRGNDLDTHLPTTHYKVQNNIAGGETILTISSFSRITAGQYQCFARNQYGEAQQNVQIDVGIRPSFIQPLLDKVFSDAQPVKLEARVDGVPTPEVKWMKDWHPIAESHRVKFVFEEPYTYAMIITDPIWRDSGIYSVVASNDAGQSTTSCTVTVEADGDYNDVELPRRRVGLETRKPRELYDIDETNEK